MKTILSVIFSVLFYTAQSQTFAIVFGVNDEYTKTFCKELTANGISWSLCDILDNRIGVACNTEVDIIANRYQLKAFDNLWLPIVLVRSGTREQGFNVAADRNNVMGKIKAFITTTDLKQYQTSILYDGHVIRNPERKEITLFTVNGYQLLRSNDAEINLCDFTPGIYILRAGNQTKKIVVR